MSSDRHGPYLDYRFAVELDALIVAGFAEVSGLERELETEEYEEGGVNHFTHSLPTRVSYPTLTLERGVTDSTELWDWAERAANGLIERKNVRVIILDEQGQEARGWEFRDAYPVRWAGPELSAEQGAVAMEALELTHRGISRLEGLPPR